MYDHDRLCKNSDFVLEDFDDEILLYTPLQSKAMYLNDTANLVWQLCDGQKSVGEIISLLEQAYPTHSDQIRSDVVNVLQVLMESEALQLTND